MDRVSEGHLVTLIVRDMFSLQKILSETHWNEVEADIESSDLFIDRSNIHSYTEGEDWMSPSQAAEMLVFKDGGIQVTPNYLQYCLITTYNVGSVTIVTLSKL